jgi:hypothetical protein
LTPDTYPALPSLSGEYRSSDEHPRVFFTPDELEDLAARVNVPDSYSMQRFGQLAGQIARDLAARNDWSVTYSGCKPWIYQYAFSYEPQDGHGAEISAALKLPPNTVAPAGAAVVASRLALYAALVKAGATPPAGAPTADEAAGLAKRILLAWAERGFKDAQGRFLSVPSMACDNDGKVTVENAGGSIPLELGRGVVYSVHAQDLLQSFGALNAKEESELNALHSALFDLIRQAFNVRFGLPYPECERYSNHAAAGLDSLMAIARLLNDGRRLNAVLYGADRSMPVVLPWTKFFDHAIYGESDHPVDCYDNPGPDSLTSHPSFQTPNVAPGEVEDRYRNANPLQGIGYSMGTLGGLINMAEILRIAGFDSYEYRGAHEQSIEMAIEYYACLAKGAGFYKTVTAENSGSCPNAAQYYGKLVNNVERPVMFGAHRFRKNDSITDLDPAAKIASTGLFSLDAILFGKWRD